MSPKPQRTAPATKSTYKLLFASRIRSNVFGWRSSSAAVARIRDGVTEITNVPRKDPVTGAEGAVRLIELVPRPKSRRQRPDDR
jgi:hypothetical protein